MKKVTIFAAIIVLLTMVSCNQDSLNPSEAPLTWNGGTRAEKNPLDEIDFSALDTEFFVTDEDVEAYIHFKQLLAEGQGKDFDVLEVVPMGLNDEATLAYLLNYNEGWEIIAADKRAPTILGRDSNGNLPSKEAPDDIMAWIENLELDVLFLRSFSGRPKVADDETWEKMLGCIDFWKALNADSEYIERNSDVTRVAPLEDPIPLPPGHWVLDSTNEYIEVIESVGPLVTVNFHQESPFNNCCPYAYPYATKSLAGCVAVSGAQMACYLHSKIGRPFLAPIYGTCNTNAYMMENDSVVIDPNAYMGINLTNFTPTAWNVIGNGNIYTSYLIAEIGKSVFMEYGYDKSSAQARFLISEYFIPKGIMCRDSLYDSGIVAASICDEMPVILGASAFINNNDSLVGHSFIADGWRQCRTRTEKTFVWVWDEPSNIPHAAYNTVISYSPFFQELHMNWGWGASYDGDTSWYAPTGNWIADSMNFNQSRRMIWGFELFDE